MTPGWRLALDESAAPRPLPDGAVTAAGYDSAPPTDPSSVVRIGALRLHR